MRSNSAYYGIVDRITAAQLIFSSRNTGVSSNYKTQALTLKNMLDKKDYSKMTIEELLVEEKKVKKNEMFSAGFIGFLVGIMIYGVVKNGFGFLYIAIPLLLIYVIYKNSQIQKQNLNRIRTEMNVKNIR
ncbi:hypothetical protein ACW9KT_17655 [Hymenobacter sp. HD11105]